eukprot:ANDGO_07877.mRNA.1 Putative quercetin 2
MTVKIRLHASDERGHANHGWLDSYHSFSFASWHDPRFMGYESLRVINEDTVAPKEGFPSHPHSNFAIFSYILDGEITHKDSMGHTEVLGRGAVQFTNAGTGLTHSEFNMHPSKDLRFLQIWVKPHTMGTSPYYETRSWTDEEKKNKLVLLVSGKGKDLVDNSIRILQDMKTWATIVDAHNEVLLDSSEAKKKAYVHVAMIGGGAKLTVDGESAELKPGDGAFVDRFDSLVLQGTDANRAAEVLVFEF